MLDHGTSRAEKRFQSLTREILEELRGAILAGKLAPGERLFEAKLAASLKVGAVAVREALRALEAKGYVTFRADDEVVVSKPRRNRGRLRDRRRARRPGRAPGGGARHRRRDRASARAAQGAQRSLPEAR